MIHPLVRLLTLEPIEEKYFRGFNLPNTVRKRVFGGQVVAQALMAASNTVTDRLAHSLHGYFLLPGDSTIPILYQVENMRNGRSFSARRSVAIQHGEPIFFLSASFHRDEEGLTHQMQPPKVDDPENLPSMAGLLKQFGAALPSTAQKYLQENAFFDFRLTDVSRFQNPAEKAPLPQQSLWVRCREKLPDDPTLHRAVLSYLSDMTLMDTVLIAHRRTLFDTDLQLASLDHALWFHEGFRADEWLLYVQDSPRAGHARGLARGLIYNRQGILVASVAQEGLVREIAP